MSVLFLTILIFSPLLGIVLLLLWPADEERMIKWIGVFGTIPALVLACYLYLQYRWGTDLSRFSIDTDWLKFGNLKQYGPDFFAVHYELAVDGLSLVMLLLTAVLCTMGAIASLSIKSEWKGYFLLFLLLEIGMLGVFTAQNLVLFFIFFEITLIPMFFLIGKWGFLHKEKAAYSFLIYNGIGSAILLIVIMILFAKTGTTNIEYLKSVMTAGSEAPYMPISQALKNGLFFALLIAFGIKLPIFPLHGWMVKVHVQAPPSVVMLHAGVLLKIGAYGLIRFGMGIFPEQFEKWAYLIGILGVINILYGAFLALIQSDFKKVLAYSSVSHMGIVLIGLAALNEAGIQGAIFQVVSHGLIAALLFFLVGVMHMRSSSPSLIELSGLGKKMPRISGLLLAGGMASLGLPGMSGFISEFTAFLGIFKVYPVLASAGALGIILTAVYILRAVLHITFGKNESGILPSSEDIKGIEMTPVIILLGLIVLIGVYPAVLSGPLQTALDTILLGIGS
ncbi:NADH-quinone oxidoreductase subunit M [Bacillus sp. MUM 13]|uniref:complex I subunit 4 family protein n=1 Tax=Bacillus sp. MUM 13 TaxID=1678001 RepID=UPI0008F569CC|nr:NADH-quinone oxidoreductase subunit M [Bacillus sp. MUM 13]OIK12591.1 NADH-quinone oxidoreductase subunit M [Bacillus sp. MUM 13]